MKKETPLIRGAMDDVLRDWQESVAEWTPQLTSLNQRLIDSAKGGKILRGLIIKLGYDMYSQKKRKDIYRVAAAYEILHTALLIHDDVIDNAPVRRGQPTVARSFEKKHYGNAQAICIGDIGIFLAQQTIITSNLPDRIKMRLIAEISHIALKTILGEMLDIQATVNKNKNQEELFSIAQLKTAQYTIVGPLHIGAILAEEDDEILYTNQEKFGIYLGIAFQIKDDILGVLSDEKTLGKSVDSDIREGKNTLLITHALQYSTKKQKDFLRKHYGKKKINSQTNDSIKAIFIQTGAVIDSENRIESYMQKAKECIPSLTTDKKWHSILHDMITIIIEREK